MRALLLVGAGGFLGAMARYLLSGWVHRSLPFAGFPYGTLAVNLAGCAAIGFLGGMAHTHQALGTETRAFLMIGVLGAFTTYSTFGYETLALLEDAEVLKAAANVAIHVVVGLAAVWAGGAASRLL